MSAKLSRRNLVRGTSVLIGAAMVGPLLAACAGSNAAATPAPSSAAPTKAVATQPSGQATASSAASAPMTTPGGATPATSNTVTSSGSQQITWWHHWAGQPGKQQVFTEFISDYAKVKPNVKINLRWWDKAAMYPVAKDAFIAGEGFPDIMYAPPDEFITAGWYEDLQTILDWTQFNDGALQRCIRTLGGKQGMWDPPLEGNSEEIYYNPKIFDKVGVSVPASRQFTSEEFYSMSVEIRKAGFDPFAQGIGDRSGPGFDISWYALLTVLGGDAARKLLEGNLSWTTEGVSDALNWVAKMCKIPCMPPTFSTLTLAESHQYFNTPPPGKDLPRAAMFMVGAWYTGRAFQSPAQGGEPDDFRCGFLKYPTFTDGKGNGLMWGAGGSGGGSVASGSKVRDAANEAIRSFMSVTTGTRWLAEAFEPTELKTDPNPQVKARGDYDWYFKLYDETHKGQQYVTESYTTPPALTQAITAALNEGLPENQITVDKAIELLEAARKQK